MLVVCAVASVLQVGGLAFYAHLSDRYGRRPVMMFGSVLGILLTFPIFWMVANGSVALLFLGMILATRYRYTGASLGTRPSRRSAAASPRSSRRALRRPAASAGDDLPRDHLRLGLVIIRLAREGSTVDRDAPV